MTGNKLLLLILLFFLILGCATRKSVQTSQRQPSYQPEVSQPTVQSEGKEVNLSEASKKDTTSRKPAETFFIAEGSMIGLTKGIFTLQSTGTTISQDKIEVKQDEDKKTVAYDIDGTTKFCDHEHNLISWKDIHLNEKITIAVQYTNKNKAMAVRKGSILIRATNNEPIPVCE